MSPALSPLPAVPCRHGALYQARGPQWDTLKTSPINMLIPTGRGAGVAQYTIWEDSSEHT